MKAAVGSRWHLFTPRQSLAIVVAVLAGLAWSFWGATPAQSRPYHYTCGQIPPNTWCMTAETHTYGYTNATEVNAQVIWLCSKLISPGNYIYARVCNRSSITFVYSDSWGRAPYPNNSVDMKALAANGNNAGSWYIRGFAEY